MRAAAVLVAAVLAAVVILTADGGCKSKARDAGAEDTVVPVSHPVPRDVTDYADFTGRTDAKESVNIIARVTGYLKQPKFAEGSLVKAGDVLFVIDPRPYQAQYEQALSQVTLNEAQLDLAKKTLARFAALAKSQPGSVSQQALDQYEAAVTEAKARRDSQNKSLSIYQLNKEFTEVVSPIDGQVSRYYLTQGNLVNQDQTLLTTVVSLDKMYVYFDMDELTRLKIVTAIHNGQIKVPADSGMKVWLGLQNEEGYPHEATINFVNNQINSTTGSITLRAEFENPILTPPGKTADAKGTGKDSDATAGKGPNPTADKAPAPASADKPPTAPVGKAADVAKVADVKNALTPGANVVKFDRQFAPGMFVRVRFPLGEPHPALLVIDRAIQSDQGLKFVYVVDADNKAQTRSVKTKALQEDGLREVEGVKPDDWVVVGAIQQVRPNMVVKPDPRAMPTLNGTTEPASQPPAAAKGSGQATAAAPSNASPQAKGSAETKPASPQSSANAPVK